jgi:hypothetical protein
MDINALLVKYRDALDHKDEVEAALSAAKRQCEAIEFEIRSALEQTGQWTPGAKVGTDGITCTVCTKWRAKYEPEKWKDIVKWAVETGNEHLIQRRLSDKPVMEIIDTGGTLPEGLSVQPFDELKFRRK